MTSSASTAPAPRPNDRAVDSLRDVTFTPDFSRNADGSVLVEFGGTRVICTASIDANVPRWLQDSGLGWVSAEYMMLPASTGARKKRETTKRDGRSVEIQRLIGRSLRAIVDRAALGPRSITVDCDVLDADGGTRCAAITGGYVALHRALQPLVDAGDLPVLPLTDTIAAVSVGIVGGEPRLDLEYVEDSVADVDANVVLTGAGRLVEVQASAEGATFDRAELDVLLDLATAGTRTLASLQLAAATA